MAKLVWDQTGERIYETGVDHGVLYLHKTGKYDHAVAWNGLVNVTESPSGAEPNPLYADNIKYLNLISVEEFGATIEAYTYPDEFAVCDGSYSVPVASGHSAPVSGISFGQQPRQTFGFCYRTRVGNDEKADSFGYKLHLVYGAQAAPSEKAYSTVNDSPEAITFSWTLSTTAVAVEGEEGVRPTAIVTVDSTKVPAKFLKALEDKLYGTESDGGSLPLPHEVAALYKANASED